jgi:hypothetical protein
MITMKLPPGVTYRQLRYWVNQGYLPETLTAGSAMGGRKNPADTWTEEQWRMLTLMGKLRSAGIEAKQAGAIAVKAATQMSVIVSDISVVYEVGPGVEVWVDPWTMLGETWPRA